ncbi:hypothetical protein PIB30_086238 [Stylosanthes scabra]|uniref:Uncharacterized protein n=1 Tax=Stylosanthes scabra TaxID=79078 RepID=A0ABU6YQM4_9FABA|nr:hypothetical protein [Stylosanthes scabra]
MGFEQGNWRRETPFSSLEHAISFAREIWFRESSIGSWLNAFSAHSCIADTFLVAPVPIKMEIHQWGRTHSLKFGFGFITSMDKHLSQQILDDIKARCENSLIVELDIASQEEFKLIENDLALLWQSKKMVTVRLVLRRTVTKGAVRLMSRRTAASSEHYK